MGAVGSTGLGEPRLFTRDIIIAIAWEKKGNILVDWSDSVVPLCGISESSAN